MREQSEQYATMNHGPLDAWFRDKEIATWRCGTKTETF